MNHRIEHYNNGIEAASSSSEKKVYNKLVRDRIPEIIAAKGGSSTISVLDEEAFKEALRVKLTEELEEYFAAEDDESALLELADVIEVIRALSKVHGSTHEGLENKRVDKLNKNGGFEDRVFLIDSSDA